MSSMVFQLFSNDFPTIFQPTWIQSAVLSGACPIRWTWWTPLFGKRFGLCSDPTVISPHRWSLVTLFTWANNVNHRFEEFLRYGYGSIPINRTFKGMNIHKSLMWTTGLQVWTHSHLYVTQCWRENVDARKNPRRLRRKKRWASAWRHRASGQWIMWWLLPFIGLVSGKS